MKFVNHQQQGEKEKPISAFLMALAGTLGVGNISGVALGILIGGAGSLLWMWLSALLAMLIKYAEIVLALRGQEKQKSSSPYDSLSYIGGQAGKFGHLLLTLFSFAILLSAIFLGGMLQSNAVAESFSASLGISPILVGVFLFLLTIAVIFGGGKRISAVTMRLIPGATVLYALLCFGVFWVYRGNFPLVLGRIFREGLSVRSASGGVLGYGMAKAVGVGCKRGLLSNEAGCGTAPIAHATSHNSCPERQGVWGIFEVFVDTILLCSLTGFAVLLPGGDLPTADGGMRMVGDAFELVWGNWGGFLLSFAVGLFAFATIICWSYYGSIALSVFTFSPKAGQIYRWCFALAVPVGALVAAPFMWYMTDILLGVMTAINLAAIWRHRHILRASLSTLPFLKK